ncbi:MAG: hypothetical protein QOI41_3649 [Myxococcales bacterium]|nr:hypothetical protein [Myxococcales bacterium]
MWTADLARLGKPLYSARVPRAPRVRQLRAAFLAAALGTVAALAASLEAACGDSSASATGGPDGGEESSTVPRAVCPTAEPSNGGLCLLPEGTTCDFGQCGTRLARCTQGAWVFGGNGAPSPPCPVDPPNPDVQCPACWPAAVSCTYGSSNCSAADASVNTAIASCPHGTWVLDIRPCRDGGGPDVQGDGGPDAD